jgi:hypothetical protein
MDFFKDIPNYIGRYQISKKGIVKSLGNNKSRKDKILKSSINSKGYLTVRLSGKTFCVHQLVAITFLNHNLSGYKKVIDHIDNNKLNNNIENLKVVTQRENISRKNGRKVGVYKKGNYWNVSIHFFSFKSEEEAIFFRQKIISQADKYRLA